MCNDNTVDKLKNEFHYTLSKFSHEIRNPITLINSELQMIAAAHPEVQEYKQWDDVIDNLDYVRDLLDELSAFNNANRITPKATDTCAYLKTILSSVKPTLDYLEITLESDIPDSLPVMMLDQIKIRQMMINLLRMPGSSSCSWWKNNCIRLFEKSRHRHRYSGQRMRNLTGRSGNYFSTLFHNQRIRNRTGPSCCKTDR